jgi:hypothetical protein
MIRTARTVVGEFFSYVMRVGVFLVAGPLVGGLALLLGAALAGHPEALGLVILLPLFLAGCAVGGWKPALLTGLIVSLVGPFLPSRRMIVILAAIVGGVSAALLGPTDEARSENAGTMIALLAFAGAVASAACAWFLDRMELMRVKKPSAA